MSARERYGWAAAAAAGAMLTYVVASNGLAFVAVPTLQVAVLAGLIAGMLARDVPTAAAATAAGLALGILQQPAGSFPPPVEMAVTVGAGVGIAALVCFALTTAALRRSLVVAVALVLVVGNLWLSAATVAPMVRQRGTAPSMYEVLQHRPIKGEKLGDSGFYRNVVWKMRDGAGYYQAYHDAWFETWTSTPLSIFAVRQPTIFWLWAKAPGWPRSAIWLFLAFATAGVVAAPLVSHRAVPVALGLVGSVAIAAYMLRYATEPGLLFLQEPWVGALAVIVFGLFALAQDDRRHRPFMIAAGALALVAMMLRELMLFVIIAGILASFFAKRERRRFDVAVWMTALVAGLAYWGVHALRTDTVFAGRTPDPSAWVGNDAGVVNLLQGLTHATILLNYHAWLPVALAVLGIVGALVQPDKQYRVFATAAVLMPLVGFLFLSNGAMDVVNATPSNYWGGIVVPALLALAPSAFALLPAVGVSEAEPSAEGDDASAASPTLAEAG